MVRGTSVGNGFCVVNTWRARVRKRLKRSALYFWTHISNRPLDKTVSSFFLAMSCSFFIFYFDNSTSFESTFCMKRVESRLFKKIFEKKKIAGTILLALWLAKCHWKELQKTEILLVQELMKYEKYGQTLTLIFSIFGEREMGKLYLSKKVGLAHLKRYYKNMYIISL